MKNVCIEVKNDNIDKFGLAVGQEVELQCEIDARQWQDKWFNSIICRDAIIIGVQEVIQYADSVPSNYKPNESIKPVPNNDQIDGTDDLPF